MYERSCFWNVKKACHSPPPLPIVLREQSRCSRGTARCGSLLRWQRKAYRPTPMPQRLCSRDIALSPSHRHHQPRRSTCPAPQSAPVSKGRVSIYFLEVAGGWGLLSGKLVKGGAKKEKKTKTRREHISVIPQVLRAGFFFFLSFFVERRKLPAPLACAFLHVFHSCSTPTFVNAETNAASTAMNASRRASLGSACLCQHDVSAASMLRWANSAHSAPRWPSSRFYHAPCPSPHSPDYVRDNSLRRELFVSMYYRGTQTHVSGGSMR